MVAKQVLHVGFKDSTNVVGRCSINRLHPFGRTLSDTITNRWFALPPCWCTKQKKICSHNLRKDGS